jgi:hypothetical protein
MEVEQASSSHFIEKLDFKDGTGQTKRLGDERSRPEQVLSCYPDLFGIVFLLLKRLQQPDFNFARSGTTSGTLKSVIVALQK